MDSIFYWGAICGLALLLGYVIYSDFTARRIPNWLTLSVALLAFPFWWSQGLSAGEAVQQAVVVAAASVIFGLLWQAGYWTGRRLLGGGDLKLYVALAFWLPPYPYLQMLVWMSVAGLLLTLAVWWLHRRRGAPGRVRVPYGVAIAVGAYAVLGEQIIKQFAA